jgi:hypothetical protein
LVLLLLPRLLLLVPQAVRLQTKVERLQLSSGLSERPGKGENLSAARLPPPPPLPLTLAAPHLFKPKKAETSGRAATLARAGLLFRLEITAVAFLVKLARRTQASKTRTHQLHHLVSLLCEIDSRTLLLSAPELLLLHPDPQRKMLRRHLCPVVDLLGALLSLDCPTDQRLQTSSRTTSERTPLPTRPTQSAVDLLHLLALLFLSAAARCLMSELLLSSVLLHRSPLASLTSPRSQILLMTRRFPLLPALPAVRLLVSL